MQAHTAVASQPKVTLANWERLNYAPLPLGGSSAVQWNDHMFVLAQDSMPLLYHTKSKIWSMLPKSPYTSLSNAPPALTLHNDQILTMSKKGQVAAFDPRFSDWTELSDMSMKIQTGYDCQCLLVSYNSNLYAIVALEKGIATSLPTSLGTSGLGGGLNVGIPLEGSTKKSRNPPMGSTNMSRISTGGLRLSQRTSQKTRGVEMGQSQQIKDCCTIYSYDSNSKWTEVSEFGKCPLQSAAIVDGTAFVHTGGEMYEVFLEKKQEKTANQPHSQQLSGLSVATRQPGSTGLFNDLPTVKLSVTPKKIATEIASPPYIGLTLYAIKDTLFSFGGRDRDNQPTSDVLHYNSKTDTWESAGYMRSCRYNVAVTTRQDTTLDVFVVGGSFGTSQHIMKQRAYINDTRSTTHSYIWDNKTNILEKCTVN